MTNRIQREKNTIEAMLRIYCRYHHGADLCGQCRALLGYAQSRLDNCPFHSQKPACNHCTVHCYAKSKQQQIRQVMRFAGPRMLYRHPLLALGHLLDTFRKPPELG